MAVNFVTVDRETPDMFQATVREQLPEIGDRIGAG